MVLDDESTEVDSADGGSGDPSETLQTATQFSFDTVGEDTERVLFVDDEPHILKAVRRLTMECDYEVLTAENAEEAIEFLQRQTVAVLVSDQRMPGMSGAELLDYARKNNPQTVRIMLTGNSEVSTALEAINRGAVFRFVTKPWDHDGFLQLIDLGLEQYRLRISRDQYERHIEAKNQELHDLNAQLRQFNEELEERVEERTREIRTKNQEVARLYEELKQSFDGMIKALLSIMELGETYIIEHCQRTADRIRRFGEFLELDDELVRELERAALLHWIGLINASPSLFRKSVDEFDAVEAATWEFHPLLGQQALRHVPTLQRVGRFILYYLHRHNDPEFQPGVAFSDAEDEVLTEEFIRGCQLLRICSAFEQVRTSRQGVKLGDEDDERAWVQEGLEVLEEGSGTHFDPDLVESFQGWIGEELEPSRSRAVVVSFEELEPGMVLARPLETRQGIPVAPRDMIITDELLERLKRFRDSNGLKDIHVWD